MALRLTAILVATCFAPCLSSQMKLAPHSTGPPAQVHNGAAKKAAREPSIFSEAGYNAIASTGNRTQLAFFVTHLLTRHSMKIKDEDHLNGMLRFYDGECAKQSYKALVAELRRGLRPRGCFNAFIEPKKANALLQVSEAAEATLFAEEDASALSSADGEDVPLPTWQWRRLMRQETMSLAQTGTEQKGPIEFFRSTYSSMNLRLANYRIQSTARSATLNAQGYNQVAALKDASAMETYALRVLEKEGLRVKDPKVLRGMLRFYDGECGTQSYKNLVRELRLGVSKRMSCGGPFIEQINATKADLNESATSSQVHAPVSKSI